jgi:16S rRNA (guanine966-N2)-methyltransferase
VSTLSNKPKCPRRVCLNSTQKKQVATTMPNTSNEVRIIAGQWKRSKLAVPNIPGLRPTPDRVRETLFNWLGPSLDGWRCLDAFAGSGALGFEAASRGASQVTLLERDPRLVRHLCATQERLHGNTLRIEAADAVLWMKRCQPQSFELIFLDPPFDANLFEPACQAAAQVVVAGGFLYLEANQPFTDIDNIDIDTLGLKLHRQGRAGQVHYHLFQRCEPT